MTREMNVTDRRKKKKKKNTSRASLNKTLEGRMTKSEIMRGCLVRKAVVRLHKTRQRKKA